MNPNDAVRDAILRRLYDCHRKAKSPTSAAVGIRDLQSALKPLGHKQQDVAHNLDYLLQRKWAVEIVEQRTFQPPRGTTQTSPKRSYKISDIGIDKLETASTYSRTALDGTLSIVNVNGVTVVGDGNVVNTRFTDLSRLLADLRAELLAAPSLSDTEKWNVAVDLDGLLNQLQKPKPDRVAVRALWNAVEATATAAGFADAVHRAVDLIAPLLG